VSRLVLVTGGRKGIGGAIVDLLRPDYEVIYTTSSEAHCGDDALFLDLSSEASISSLAEQLQGRKIFALVNNAGVYTRGNLEDYSFSDVSRSMEVNLTAPIKLTAQLLPQIMDEGRIINIASVLGRAGRDKFSLYCTSKHGMIGLTRALALELAHRKITVNAVCPGWVTTDMQDLDFSTQQKESGEDLETLRQRAMNLIPLQRFLLPEEIAGVVAYLISDQAKNITGQEFTVDGGELCL